MVHTAEGTSAGARFREREIARLVWTQRQNRGSK